MNWSAMLVASLLLSGSESNQILDFALDFTMVDNTGPVQVCNFVTCWGIDNLMLMKKTSENFRCSAAVKSPKMSIADWFVPGIRQLFVVDLTCAGTDELLVQAESLGLFNDHVIWLAVSGEIGGEPSAGELNEEVKRATEAFENLYVTALSQFHVAVPVSERKLEIRSVYKRNPTEGLIHENLGYWTKEEGVVFTGVKLPSARRWNTEGRVFKTAGVITDDDSLNHLYDLVDPQIDNPTKIHFTYWEHIIQGMNGSMEFFLARNWGEKINGSYNGMLGYIQRNEAEIAVSPMYINDDRMKFMRYLAIGHFFRIKMLFLSPPLSYKNNIYFLPFSNDVWYSCILLFAVSVILVYTVARHEDGKLRVEVKTRNKPLTISWIDIILLHLGTVCQQDLYIEPKGICGRIIILHVKIFVLFAYVFYSASILVLLQSSDRSITTLKALDESNFAVSSHDTPYNRFYFKTISDPVGRSLVSKVTNGSGFTTPEVGIMKVRDGFFAFNVNTATGYLLVRQMFSETDCCRLQELDESLIPGGNPLMAVRKNLPYREIISVMFQKISERGFVKRESRRKSAEKPPCEQSQMSYANIGIIDSEGAFQLLLFAFVLSFVILLAELQLFNMKGRKTKPFVLEYGYHE